MGVGVQGLAYWTNKGTSYSRAIKLSILGFVSDINVCTRDKNTVYRSLSQFLTLEFLLYQNKLGSHHIWQQSNISQMLKIKYKEEKGKKKFKKQSQPR